MNFVRFILKAQEDFNGMISEIHDVFPDWYDILKKRSDLARDRLPHNKTTVQSNADIKQEKQPPVDRGKRLIGLEHCQVDVDHCETCPYSRYEFRCSIKLRDDARAYIYYLEEQLKEARKHDCG